MQPRKRRAFEIGLLVLALSIGSSSALAGEPALELIPANATSNDSLGAASAISGSVALVAAPRDNVFGTLSGSAYLFDVTTGLVLHKLAPNDGAPFEEFGFSASISGNVAVCGSYKNIHNGAPGGAVYVFDVTAGTQTFKLLANDRQLGDNFGFAVGVSGNLAVVSAPGDDDVATSAGAAYVFNVSTGQQLLKLTANDGAMNDFFGIAVAIDGNTVIVGAPNDGGTTGSAYLFDATTGAQLDKLTASSPQVGAYFGREVAVSGNRALVGAPFGTFGATPDTGLAYVFDTTNGNQLQLLRANDGVTSDLFGQSVGISGDLAVVGASEHAAFGAASGAAYVFDITTGQQTSKLTPHDARPSERFGDSLGVSGERVVVGAVTGFGGAPNSGSAHAYRLSGAAWDNLALGKAGVDGVPSLLGVGDLSGASDLCFALGHAAPNTAVLLVIGLTNLSVPAKGGVLVPSLDLILTSPVTDSSGQYVLQTIFPPGTPAGVPIYAQFWVPDASVFPPYAASNGVAQTTP